MRYHGETECEDGEEEVDFSRETLTADVLAVWHALFAEQAPPTVLVGHSVGGAIAVWAALETGGDAIPALEGLIVIDVVEGTAICAPLPTCVLDHVRACRRCECMSLRRQVGSLCHRYRYDTGVRMQRRCR